MARPVDARRRALIAAQKTLRDAKKQASGAGYTLRALLERAEVSPGRWKAWMAGSALPQAASLDAIKTAAALLAGGYEAGGREVAE